MTIQELIKLLETIKKQNLTYSHRNNLVIKLLDSLFSEAYRWNLARKICEEYFNLGLLPSRNLTDTI